MASSGLRRYIAVMENRSGQPPFELRRRRFRAIDEGAGEAPLQVACFEPEHHIVEATAPFFASRFTTMRWAIRTPERSVRGDEPA